MADDDFRTCPSCRSRNRGGQPFCVRCGASMSATASGASASIAAPRARPRWTRFLLAAGLVVAVGVGYAARTVSQATEEVSALSEDVRADGARKVDTPPPAVTGWYPGANLPEPEKAMPRSAPIASAPLPSSSANPYDAPGDPSASMVGIAPRAPRARPAAAGKRVFTEEDLLATREGAWSTPPPQAPQNDADDAEDADDDDDDSDDDD